MFFFILFSFLSDSGSATDCSGQFCILIRTVENSIFCMCAVEAEGGYCQCVWNVINIQSREFKGQARAKYTTLMWTFGVQLSSYKLHRLHTVFQWDMVWMSQCNYLGFLPHSCHFTHIIDLFLKTNPLCKCNRKGLVFCNLRTFS